MLVFLPFPLPLVQRRSHLTDFAGARAPAIAVASSSDMFNINPADIFLKVKTRKPKP